MKIGLLGLFTTDLTDVTPRQIKWAGELGFHGIGIHLNVPARTIPDSAAAAAKAAFAEQHMASLQLAGPYPCIITPDESIRQAGVEGARDVIRLAAKLDMKEALVRPTSLNPRGDWWPHADNYLPETEDRLVKSLNEILQTAEEYGIDVVLEAHVTSTLNSAQTIKRVIERTGSKRLKLNLDVCNFVKDLQTAFNPAPMINEMFDLVGQYIATVHLKDYYLEDRLVVHISETVIGTGLMDFDTILRRVNEMTPDGYVVIEHLPIGLVPQAKQNLTAKIRALGYPLG